MLPRIPIPNDKDGAKDGVKSELGGASAGAGSGPGSAAEKSESATSRPETPSKPVVTPNSKFTIIPRSEFTGVEDKKLTRIDAVAWTQDITHGYDAALSTESYELPDASALGVRMLGVSLEHGLLQGVDSGSTEVMLAGLEYYLKDLVQQAFERVKRRRRGSPSSHGVGAAVPGTVDQQEDMITVEDMAMILESAPNCFVEVSGPLYRLNDVMLRNDDEEMEDYDMGVSGGVEGGGVGSGGGGDQKLVNGGGTEGQANGRVEGNSSSSDNSSNNKNNNNKNNNGMHGLSFGGVGQNGSSSIGSSSSGSSSHLGVGVAAGLGLTHEGSSANSTSAAAAAAANGTAGTAGRGSGGSGAAINGISDGNAVGGSGMGTGMGTGMGMGSGGGGSGLLGNQAAAAAGLRHHPHGAQASSGMSGGIGVGGSNLANNTNTTNIGNNSHNSITTTPAMHNNNNNNNNNNSNRGRSNGNHIGGAGGGGGGGSHDLSEYQENERQLSSLLEDLLHESVG